MHLIEPELNKEAELDIWLHQMETKLTYLQKNLPQFTWPISSFTSPICKLKLQSGANIGGETQAKNNVKVAAK